MTATGPTTRSSSNNRRRTTLIVVLLGIVVLFVALLVARSAWRSHEEGQWLERLHGELDVLPVPSGAFLEAGPVVDTERRLPDDDFGGWDWGACRTYVVTEVPFVAGEAARQVYLAAGYQLLDQSRKDDGFSIELLSPDEQIVVTIGLPFSATGPPWGSLAVCAHPNRSNYS